MVTVEVMRNMLKEMLEKHEQNLMNVIKANVEITNKRLDKLEALIISKDTKLKEVIKDTEEIKSSLQFYENTTDERLTRLERSVKEKNEYLERETYHMRDKLRQMEDRSRRNNLRIDGIGESEKESWMDCETKVLNIIKEKLNICDNITIERAHRFGKKRNDGIKPRTIIFKFLNYKDKTKILEKAKLLKGIGLFVSEDFSHETMMIRKDLWNEVLELRQSGRYAIIKYEKIYSRAFR